MSVRLATLLLAAIPLWVPAERAVDETGALRTDLLGSHEPGLRRTAEQNGHDECRLFRGTVPGHHFKPNQTLHDLSKAEIIVSGPIRDMTEGFLGGLPGTLLEIEATYLKGDPPPGRTFLFYPIARIETAHGLLCAKPLDPYHPPKLGDTMVVFGMTRPRLVDNDLILQVDTRREVLHIPQ